MGLYKEKAKKTIGNVGKSGVSGPFFSHWFQPFYVIPIKSLYNPRGVGGFDTEATVTGLEGAAMEVLGIGPSDDAQVLRGENSTPNPYIFTPVYS